MEAGELDTVIDRTFPLQDIVGAHEYVETGAKQGNLVVIVGGGAA
jgi:NADPH:quinone reductase-like Zn-dependent oxidoreductase